ncbi:MAG: glycosyltransferase family 2 protein [Acidimicrobiales bacterium]
MEELTKNGAVEELNDSHLEDWFEARLAPDAPLERFVERRRGGRRRSDHRVIETSDSPPTVRSTVSVVIPTMNEARNITGVLERLPDIVDEVVLVDGRSVDVTKLMAATTRPNIRFIDEHARGKGVALRAGLAAATGDIIIAMDADGSMSPEEIPRFVNPLEHGFDLAKGSRFVAGGGSLDITRFRRLGNRGLVLASNILLDVHYTDLCYGFFALRRIFLEALDLRSTGFEIETEITVRAQIIGLRIAEVPSVELPRRNGESNLRTIRDGFRVLGTLLSERRRSSAVQLCQTTVKTPTG